MQTRIDYSQVYPDAIKALTEFDKYVRKTEIDQRLIDLINIRASQINHCAYCLDMHVKDARASGEPEQRLHSIAAWRETPFFSDRERAALAWTEAVTLLTDGFVPDDVYEQARQQFSETELIGLTMAIVEINGWNRMNVSLRMMPGWYQSQRKPDPARIPELVNG